DKAKDLGRLIGQSAEYQAFKRVNDAIRENRESAELFKRLETLRMEAEQMMERGEQPPEAMEAELGSLMTQLQSSQEYQRAIVAQENFDKLMLRVNEWITEGIRTGAKSPIITLA
ncbi:MAG: YlbF family regulator, partial [Gemmatimonadaceae bacterium]|nr:YlbF family regulator [Gemmatimonadaceae bacterium]